MNLELFYKIVYVVALPSISKGNSKTPRLPRVIPQKPQIFGSEMGREGGAICIFLESPALMNGATIAFRFAVQLSRASSYCQLIAIFFCALPLSPFARSKTDLASFRASCTFFSGSKRHRSKEGKTEGPPRGIGVPGRPRGWHFLCRILALFLIIS